MTHDCTITVTMDENYGRWMVRVNGEEMMDFKSRHEALMFAIFTQMRLESGGLRLEIKEAS